MDKETLRFILHYSGKCRGKMLLSVLSSIISVACGFTPYISVYQLLIRFINHSQVWEDVMFWCVICLVGYIGKVLFYEISTMLSHQSAYEILELIRGDLSDKLLKLPLGFVIDKPIGKLKSIIVDHVETIELPLAHLIPEGVAYSIAPLAVFLYMISIDWRMALASLITIPVVCVLSGPAMGGVGKKYDEYMKASNYMNSTIIEYIEGIEVIKTFNQSDLSYKKYSDSIKDFLHFTLDWFKSMWVSGCIMTSVLPSTLFGVLPVGMILYRNGELTPAELVLCIILSMGLVAPMMGLTTYLNSLKAIKYAVCAVNEIGLKEELPEVKKEAEIKNYNINFENISFRYQKENEENVIHGLSCELKENSFTAVIGPSGSGKSTIARLIARFWDVNEGKITIGGTDIREIPLSQLSHMISYVAQDNFLFNCSLKENIRLGNPKATDEEVYEAAKAAMCHEFIDKLENGYDTLAGEAGDKLSGGEKQRIAIARMILRNAAIVILDEATAFTDPENEHQIQQAIARLSKGKTLLVIAHRLSTITNADNILLLENGAIKEQGTHKELMENSEVYRKMWESHIGAKKWATGNSEAASGKGEQIC